MAKAADILGMNARNLLYIRPYNKRKAKAIADNKAKSKKILAKAGINTAKLFALIKDQQELDRFDWQTLPETFVIKPNKGFGGEGIMVIAGKKDGFWFTGSEKYLTEKDFYVHIRNILDGNYSMAGLPDEAIIEEKVEMDPVFKNITYKGMPDVRIIVFNKVPVMAMLRLPTKMSKGKANLATGGVGVGIDIAEGVTTHALIKKPRREYIKLHPDTKTDLQGFEIPHWNEMLEIAIKAQEATNIGYMGIDITLAKNIGPLVFEVNARPGLEIQNVNRAPLRKRLERVADLKVDSVKKGIRLAKDLFGGEIEKNIEDSSGKQVIGIHETVEIVSPGGKNIKVLAKIDTGAGLTSLDRELAKTLELKQTGDEAWIHSASGTTVRKIVNIEFIIEGERIKTKAAITDREHLKYPIIIGVKDLRDFYIDPTKKKEVKVDYKKIDRQLSNHRRQLPGLVSAMSPINLDEEKEKFFADKDYNPVFQYRKLDFDPDVLKKSISRVQTDRRPLGLLFMDTRTQLLKVIDLLVARGLAKKFTELSEEIYGTPDKQLLQKAKIYAKRYQGATKDDSGEAVGADIALEMTREMIEKYKLDYEVETVSGRISRISVNHKTKKILIDQSAIWISREVVKETLAHEIETHVFRYLNGCEQPFKIFADGTPNYCVTGEGLSIFNEVIVNKNALGLFRAALYVIAINTALKKSFAETYREVYTWCKDKDLAWRITARTKRGLKDTGKPGAYTKAVSYLRGYVDLLNFTKKGGSFGDLYMGKVDIEDLPTLEKVRDVKKPKYLPPYYE